MDYLGKGYYYSRTSCPVGNASSTNIISIDKQVKEQDATTNLTKEHVGFRTKCQVWPVSSNNTMFTGKQVKKQGRQKKSNRKKVPKKDHHCINRREVLIV
eukprot:7940738-Ditylum_brightwellii.AAC.1